MPRIKQLYPKYVNDDFIKELRRKMVDYNYTSFKQIAEIIHIAPRTLYRRVEKPDMFSVSDFRKLVPLLHPDPSIVLVLLGYTKQDIKRFKSK